MLLKQTLTLSQGKILPPVDNRDYQQKRRDAYKPIGEQLDMQYWDKINGTHHWQNHIATVKQQYPKS